MFLRNDSSRKLRKVGLILSNFNPNYDVMPHSFSMLLPSAMRASVNAFSQLTVQQHQQRTLFSKPDNNSCEHLVNCILPSLNSFVGRYDSKLNH